MGKKADKSVITPEGEARLKALVENSAKKLREGEERWAARQQAQQEESVSGEVEGVTVGVSKSVSTGVTENRPAVKKSFFETPIDTSRFTPGIDETPRLRLPHPVLAKATPSSAERGRPTFTGHSQQAVIKCLLINKLNGMTYHDLARATGVARENLVRIGNALHRAGFIEKAVDRLNRNVLIPNDTLAILVKDHQNYPPGVSESVTTSVPVSVTTNPSESLESESRNQFLPSEVDNYHAILSDLDKERWKEMYPFLSEIGVTHTLVAKAFAVQRDKGMANVQTFQRALLKCDFEAQRVIEQGYQVLDKKGEPIKSLASFYRHTLAAYGDYRNPEGWVDPELARNRELSQLAEQIKAAREEATRKFYDEWKSRLSAEDKTRLLTHARQQDKVLSIVSDDMALKMIFEKHAALFIQLLQDDLFLAIPPDFFPPHVPT